jgi:hypothetical protein
VANIPNASKYTAAIHRPSAAPQHRPRPRPEPQPATATLPAAGHRGWIVGLALILAVLIALLVATNHPWLAVIGAAASGAGIAQLLQR